MTYKPLIDQVADEVITHEDYKKPLWPVEHKMWPVSYINDQGKQVDALYTFDPSRVDAMYWVGEPIIVVADHIQDMPDIKKDEKIARLKAEIAKLENDNEA